MQIIEAFATKNKCYRVATPLTPQGIMLHSTGAPQPIAYTGYGAEWRDLNPAATVHGYRIEATERSSQPRLISWARKQ